jgi:uncharacterized circularly permuted ATP-grasp superfamily protein/uncharacterized alpha-E superfamily protein
MVDGKGGLRLHWQAAVGSICSLPNDLIQERRDRIHRHLLETGIAPRTAAKVSTAAGAHTTTAPWDFDVLPLILPAQEWEALALGLRQRARLIDAILRDLYGPQTVLSQGLYPPALIHANRRFLRAARNSLPPGARFLHAYAADLVRTPSGQWQVVNDRLDAPAGAGLVLENRLVLARSLPEVFRAAPVRRLRPFYELWQQSLQALAPAQADNPRMVLLTPGPYSQTYVEHAALARELNLVLAEGADLTVRGDRVYLKSLSGLHPVDVVLRRIDSEYADPLELRPDSALGVCGLLQAVRGSHVGMANALGCGVLETPALAAFLPQLCRHLLGEELALPSLPTWWCGTQGQREAGLAQRQGRLIRPTFPSSVTESLDLESLSQPHYQALMEKIRAHPGAYVVQEKPTPSTTPVWIDGGGMEARPLVLRMFLASGGAAGDGDYSVLPGGFARVSPSPTFEGLDAMALAHGGISKDVWVLADSDGDTVVPAPPPAAPLELRRSAGELPSRVADNLYWLGRYAERADNAARLLRATLGRLAEGVLGPRERTEVTILSALLTERFLLDRPVSAALADGPAVAQAIIGACGEGRALDQLLLSIGRLLPGVRDRLSPDLLHVLGPHLDKTRIALTNAPRSLDGALDSLESLIVVLAALGGMVSENMTRHAGWRFLDMGRKIERAQFTSTVLRGLASRTIPGPTEPGLRLALELCDSTITYRSRYRAALQTHAVLDLVVADQSNPRSLAHQVDRMLDHLGALRDPDGLAAAQTAVRLGHAAMAVLWGLEADLASDPTVVKRLDAILARADSHLAALNDAITRTFFSHVHTAQSLGYGSSLPSAEEAPSPDPFEEVTP